MSYWITRMFCKKCGTKIDVPGGVIGTRWMGRSDLELCCVDRSCDGRGYANFERCDAQPGQGAILAFWRAEEVLRG